MNLRRVLGVLVLCLTLTSGVALADYRPEGDLTLSVTAAPRLLNLRGTSTGADSFALQEGVHKAVTRSTGQSVDHDYIWIMVNGHPILAVDPFWCGYPPGRN